MINSDCGSFVCRIHALKTSAKDTDTLEKRESANWTYLEYILQECDGRGIVGKFEASFILVGQ